MCLALYLASDWQLPILEDRGCPEGEFHSLSWVRTVQRFCTEELGPERECVRLHFTKNYVVYAGSFQGCSCGFNFAQLTSDYPPCPKDDELAIELDAAEMTAARESVAELRRYVRDSRVSEIYACWNGEEAMPTIRERTLTADMLGLPDFIFNEQELLKIDAEG